MLINHASGTITANGATGPATYSVGDSGTVACSNGCESGVGDVTGTNVAEQPPIINIPEGQPTLPAILSGDTPTVTPPAGTGATTVGNTSSATDSSQTQDNSQQMDQALASGDNSGKGGGDNGNSNASNTNDKCSNSVTINGKYGCNSTNSLMQTSQVTTAVGQMAGSMTVGMMGQSETNSLAQSGATQSQSMEAAANLQEKAAALQLALGATQAYMGYREYQAGKGHSTTADTLKSEKAQLDAPKSSQTEQITSASPTSATAKATTTASWSSANGDVGNAMALASGNSGVKLNGNVASVSDTETGVGMNAQAAAQLAANSSSAKTLAKSRDYVSNANKMMNRAINEQLDEGDTANSAGTMDMIRGGGTAFMGMMAIAAAQQEKNAAKELNNAGNGAVPTGADPFSPVGNSGTGTVAITGNGTNPNPTLTPNSNGSGAMPGGTLGNPVGGPPGNGLAGSGPAPGAFQDAQAGAAGAGMPGGGDMGLSGGTAPAAANGNGDPSPQYASNAIPNGGAAYSGQGGFSGNRGGGGGAGNPGLSLKDAFAQLLGGGQPRNAPTQDILAYRGIASDSSYAPLGQQENFFKIIHSAYENLQRKGQVGL